MSGAAGRSAVSFEARVSPRGGVVLRSPVSGAACVYWRVRVVEQIDARLHLVHEIASPEAFDLIRSGAAAEAAGPSPDAGAPPVQIAVAPETARIRATPVLHRPGSPGALAAAQAFGFSGAISVEEVMVRPDDEIDVSGVLEADDGAASPFRQVGRALELYDATLTLPTRSALGPVILPWALGTAAALLGAVGGGAYIAWRFLPRLPMAPASTPSPVPDIGRPVAPVGPPLPTVPDVIGPQEARLPRFP
jgi:hypothetical protein